MKINNLKNQRGFTLLEALVAISILMVAVAAPITIAQKGLSSASYSKDQMIASYLVQDALEYIKNKRDTNSINGNDWLDGLGVCAPGPCSIDTRDGNTTSSVDELKIDNGFYGHIGSEDTRFTREIRIKITKDVNILGDNNEALVNVKVSWPGDEKNKVEVNTLIYNY